MEVGCWGATSLLHGEVSANTRVCPSGCFPGCVFLLPKYLWGCYNRG